MIAAVNGLCLGGGFELALSCDMIVAGESAVFGLPEPKVGLIAIGGGIHRLVRQVGIKQAMGPLLTGRNISAAEGFAMGFVSELVPADELHVRTAALCRDIVANAPLAVRLTKELAMWGLDQPTLAAALAGQVEHPSFPAVDGGGGYCRGTESVCCQAQARVEGAVAKKSSPLVGRGFSLSTTPQRRAKLTTPSVSAARCHLPVNGEDLVHPSAFRMFRSSLFIETRSSWNAMSSIGVCTRGLPVQNTTRQTRLEIRQPSAVPTHSSS